MKQFFLTTALVVTPLVAHGQAIETGQLGAAQAYDAGVIDARTGGLDAALWQGTSAQTAVRLMENLPLGSDNALVQDMIEAVVLSAGVPPEGSDSTYEQTRLKTVMAIGDKTALDNFVARNPDIARNPAVRADLALAGGDVAAACQIADNISEGRGRPVWAKLRAFCHVQRDELAAAELTTELLENSGYDEAAFFEVMKVLTGASRKLPDLKTISDPLLKVMTETASGGTETISAETALDSEAKPETRIKALFEFANHLSDAQITSIFSDLAYDENDLAGSSSFDFASATANKTPQGTAQVFQLAKASGDAATSAQAMGLILKAADREGVFSRFARLFAVDMQIIPANLQAEAALGLFTRAAVERGDIGTLQGLYRALPEGPEQARMALVADALGNGFVLGDLGNDIETRLQGSGAEKRRAVRDTFIALAMGSRLSGVAAIELEGAGNGVGTSVKAGDLLALSAAAKAGSRAETGLRAAMMIETSPLDDRSLAAVIEALHTAGLSQFAGRLAAEDFLTGL